MEQTNIRVGNPEFHPAISDTYMAGTLAKWFDGKPPHGSRTGLNAGEKAALRLLKRESAASKR